MSHKRHRGSHDQEQPRQAAARGPWILGLLLLMIAAGAAMVALWPTSKPRPEAQPPSNPTPAEAKADPAPLHPTASAEPAKDAIAAKPDLRKLKGRWRRSGEQYVLEVHSIDESGKVDAAYFNPRPIRIGRAMAKHEAGAAVLFVELRDTGYPGCTYALVYDPKSDQLAGIYHQAAMQQQYEVVFERID